MLDRVLGGARRYADRRAGVFVVAVNCTEPGETCFCVSAGAGPRAEAGYDLVLTELPDGGFVAGAGSPAGAELLERVPTTPAGGDTVQAADAAVDRAADRMGGRCRPATCTGPAPAARHHHRLPAGRALAALAADRVNGAAVLQAG